MSNSNPSISVVIPTHNRSDALALTLESMAKQDINEVWEVIVVNNNSADDTDAVVTEWQSTFPVELKLVHESRPGPAAARNTGAKAASGEYIVFIDNDILTPSGFLRHHLELLRSNPGTWYVGRAANPPDLRKTEFGRYRDELHESYFSDLSNDGPVEYLGATGQDWAMRREEFFAVGGFDEDFSIASCEDAELALRARKAGFCTMFDPQSVVIHNDWAIDLKTFLRRQEMYSISTVLLWKKYGKESFQMEIVRQNGPINWRNDGPAIMLKKLAKSALALKPVYPALSKAVSILGELMPDTKAAASAYETATAVAMFKGVREGFRRYAPGEKI